MLLPSIDDAVSWTDIADNNGYEENKVSIVAVTVSQRYLRFARSSTLLLFSRPNPYIFRCESTVHSAVVVVKTGLRRMCM